MTRTDGEWQRTFHITLIILGWLIIVLILGWLLGHVVRTILTLLLAGIVAFALTPLVSWLSRRVSRPLAVTLAYILAFAVIFGLLAVVITTAADQIKNLVHHL